MNDATLKALRESRGTNQPGDSIVFKDQDLNVFWTKFMVLWSSGRSFGRRLCPR